MYVAEDWSVVTRQLLGELAGLLVQVETAPLQL